ncbi:MAG: CHAT domain-containing protein, partial [Actinomycetota bacterium]
SAVVGTIERFHDGNQDAILELQDLATEVVGSVDVQPDLIIIPFGVAGLLPFGAARLTDGSHLVEHTTLTAASSTALAHARTTKHKPSGTIGFFHEGEPPLPLDQDRQNFEEIFPQDDNPAMITSNNRAGLRSSLQRGCEILHISCHAEYDVLNPLESYLRLEDDVYLEDVLDFENNAWLVNLAACETGLPDLTRLDAGLSFASAILAAGSAHVLSTLWPVDNRAAVAYSGILYSAIKNGSAVATAHRQAVLALARYSVRWESDPKSSDLGHPIFWAGFVHHGAPPPAQQEA